MEFARHGNSSVSCALCVLCGENAFRSLIYNSSAMNLTEIQAALRDGGQECWLFYDHHHRDPIAYRVLGLPPNMLVTRRWFYLIPAQGEPVKLVHRIESHHLDSLPGSKMEYSAWQELVAEPGDHAQAVSRAWSCSTRPTTRFPTFRWSMRACWSWCAASAKRSSARPTWSRV